MKLYQVHQEAFRPYGRVIGEMDFTALVEAMGETPCPMGETVYAPGDEKLEALPVSEELRTRIFGELPIQVGYCNGENYLLNAVEYHHTSEVNVAATDMILLLGRVQDVTAEQTYDAGRIEAFFVPKGTAVELYATTLHYAPCSPREGEGFRVTVVLPKGTNTDLAAHHPRDGEDRLITAKNKWLIGHPDAELPAGRPIGITGENLSVRTLY